MSVGTVMNCGVCGATSEYRNTGLCPSCFAANFRTSADIRLLGADGKHEHYCACQVCAAKLKREDEKRAENAAAWRQTMEQHNKSLQPEHSQFANDKHEAFKLALASYLLAELPGDVTVSIATKIRDDVAEIAREIFK